MEYFVLELMSSCFILTHKALSPEMSAALLRVFGLLLQGLCSNPDTSIANNITAPASSSPVWAGWLYSDEHVKRAVAWMEAIIDGHFATIALNVSFLCLNISFMR